VGLESEAAARIEEEEAERSPGRTTARHASCHAANQPERGSVTGTAVTKTAAPGFVVLRQVGKGEWQLLGEVPRKRGLPARAARTQAILDATDGTAKGGEVYAAVLRSEWRIAMDWVPPKA